MKKYNKLYLLFGILPIIDLLTAVTTRLFNFDISVGMIIKGILLLFIISYLLFFCNSKYKKTTYIYLVLISIFSVCYLIFKPEILNIQYIFIELNYLIKFLFFPIMYFGLLCYFDDKGFDKKVIINILILNCIEYVVLLLIPLITGTGFNSYTNGMYGRVGWFYAANEISTILVMLFPFIYKSISNKNKLRFLIVIPAILAICFVGTKVTLFGLIISSILCMIFTYQYNKKLSKNPFISALIIFIIIFMVSFGSSTIKNIFHVLNTPSITETIPCENCEDKEEDSFIIKLRKYGKRLLSQRNYYLKNTYEVYKDNLTPQTVIFGLGFSNTQSIDNKNISKFTEMDFFDIFFHYGIVGFIIFATPFLFILIKIFKNKKLNYIQGFYIMMILLTFGISFFSGHVFMAPAVSIYVVFYLLLLSSESNMFSKQNKHIDNK